MADFNLWQFPPPSYKTVHTFFDTREDFPGPRCGHTFTAVFHRLVLFGGIVAIENGGSEISLQGVTNSVHCFNVFTRKWTRVYPDGKPPSPRAGHAAVSKGTLILIQGGFGPSGLCNGDLHILDMTSDTFKWQKVLVEQGVDPGPRYGHVMGLANNRIVIFGGKNENEVLADTWTLDTTQNPNMWKRLNIYGDSPSERMYASASTRDNHYFMLCGGRDIFGMPLGDNYTLEPLSDGSWQWNRGPGLDPSKRFQHTAVFVSPRLHVIGGALSSTRLVDFETVVSVLDTSTGIWVDTRDGPGLSKRDSNGKYFNQVMQRCRHAAASVGNRIYVYGGFREGVLLDDLLVSEDDKLQPSSSVPANSFFIERSISARPSSLDRFPEDLRQLTTDIYYTYTPQFLKQKSTQDLVNKVEYPENIHMIRGNHESKAMNSVYGFQHECIERIGETDGENAFTLITELFNHLPLAALIGKKFFCMHGGIGSSVVSVEQIANIKRPILLDCESESKVVKDLLWDMDVVAKLIHPLPPPISPLESFPDKTWLEVDSKRPPTPNRGRPNPDFDQGSTS